MNETKDAVLSRFTAADKALQGVQRELSTLAAARSSAEATATALAAASDALTEYVQAVREATVNAVEVQEAVRAALVEMTRASSALDVSQLLQEVQGKRQDAHQVLLKLASVADEVQRCDDRVERVEVSVTRLIKVLDGLPDQVNHLMEVGRKEAMNDTVQLRAALQEVSVQSVQNVDRFEAAMAVFESRLATKVIQIESSLEKRLAELADALPWLSRRRMGR